MESTTSLVSHLIATQEQLRQVTRIRKGLLVGVARYTRKVEELTIMCCEIVQEVKLQQPAGSLPREVDEALAKLATRCASEFANFLSQIEIRQELLAHPIFSDAYSDHLRAELDRTLRALFVQALRT